MDTGGIAKIPAVTAPTAPPRADILHSAKGVATELASDAAVQQAGESEAVRFDPSRAAPGAALDATVSEFIKRNIEIDPKTREVVFQVLDRDSGRVIRQTPDEAILRLRAYIRELRVAEEGCQDCGLRIEKIA
jgi:flagellar protein FlaG